MDTLIAVLPAHVVDQIAAGEVIERPASVVKELVDNALDAGAQTVTVETQGGGRTQIRVVDDGFGMSPRDAVIAFERHATSKLRAVDELWSLATVGFRGEALPSIASIARVTLTTRRPGDLAATRVQIEGGRLVGVTEAGAPVGTCVEVSDLLYNVPARLKFMKGEATEASHITDLLGRVALAHPAIHVRLRQSGRMTLDTPPDRDGFARVAAVLGPRIASRMIAVTGQESGFRVTAYLGAPELAQTTARGVQLFVGRRPVRDRNLLHAVAMGYGELVPRGRYPLAIIFLDAPAGSVDYNVHPQKQEVRFADAPAVAAAVRHTVQSGVARAAWRDELGGGPVMMTAIASVAPPRLPLDAPPTDLAAQYARDLRELRNRPQRSLAFDGGTAGRPSGREDAHGAYRQAGVDERSDAHAAQRQAGVDERSDAHAARQAGLDFGAPGAAAAVGAGSGSAANTAARTWAKEIQDRVRHARALEADEAARMREGLDAIAHAALGELSRHVGSDAPASVISSSAFSAAVLDTSSGAMSAAGGAMSTTTGRVLTPTSGAMPTTTGGAALVGDAVPWDETRLAEGSAPLASTGFFGALRFLGQLDLTYLVCESDGELVLIDQHVAHERVELARLRAHHASRAIATQRLLFPTTIDVSAELVEVAGRTTGVLAQVGYEVEPFGRTSLAVKAVPGTLRHGDPAHLLRKLLAAWADEDDVSEEACLDQVLAEIACHSVLRAGDRLTAGEAEALLRSMDSADFRGPGPHNRPVMLRLSLADIARRFGR